MLARRCQSICSSIIDIAVYCRLFQPDKTVHSIGSDKSPIEAGRISA